MEMFASPEGYPDFYADLSPMPMASLEYCLTLEALSPRVINNASWGTMASHSVFPLLLSLFMIAIACIWEGRVDCAGVNAD